MTTDAFEKAQELNTKIHAADCLMSIISNSTLESNDADYPYHNRHIINNNVVLCYMYKTHDPICHSEIEIDNVSNSGGDTIKGSYCLSDFILGQNVPIDLVEQLENVISDYTMKLYKEFEELSGNYIKDSEE